MRQSYNSAANSDNVKLILSLQKKIEKKYLKLSSEKYQQQSHFSCTILEIFVHCINSLDFSFYKTREVDKIVKYIRKVHWLYYTIEPSQSNHFNKKFGEKNQQYSGAVVTVQPLPSQSSLSLIDLQKNIGKVFYIRECFHSFFN